MRRSLSVGLIGDYDPDVLAHQAIPRALELAGAAAGVSVDPEWVPTEEITSDARVAAFDALWCVPASPCHCRYGLNPAFREALTAGPLRVAAEDGVGDVRAVELAGHPFFVATLFQPERAALRGALPPLAAALVRAAGRISGA